MEPSGGGWDQTMATRLCPETDCRRRCRQSLSIHLVVVRRWRVVVGYANWNQNPMGRTRGGNGGGCLNLCAVNIVDRDRTNESKWRKRREFW